MQSTAPQSSPPQGLIANLLFTTANRRLDQLRGRIVAGTSLIAIVLVTLFFIIAFVQDLIEPTGMLAREAPQYALTIILLILTYTLNRGGRVALAGSLMSLMIAGMALRSDYVQSASVTTVALSVMLSVLLMGLLGEPRLAAPIAILATGIHIYFQVLRGLALNSVLAEIDNLVLISTTLISAATATIFARSTGDAFEESERSSLALVAQRAEMEDRLLNQTRQLQATVRVARAVAGTRNLDKLLADVVRLVRDTFGFYHVQIFLVDVEDSYAVLRSSTGDVGEKLLSRGHRLPVGSLSVIGQVTSTGQPVVARDTDTDAVHRRNELLPNTRSEMAIPLKAGERVIGALDLQSTSPDAFIPEIMPTLQALADQVAIAIENARLFEQAEESLRELRTLSAEMSQRSWSEFLSETREDDRRYVVGTETKALEVQRSRVVERVIGAGTVIVSTGADGNPAFIAVPVVVRNEVVGVLGVEPDSDRRTWSQEDLQIMQGIAERTALAVENARLYLQARRAAEREALINQVAARLQRAPSLALLLESAARELAEALGTDSVYAEISLDKPLAHAERIQPENANATIEGAARPGPQPDTPSASDETEGAHAL